MVASVCFIFLCVFVIQHIFALEQRDELVKCIQEAAAAYVGIAIKQRKDPISFDQSQLNRMGKYR